MYAVDMKKENTNKSKPYYVPRSIQKFFTYTVIGLYFAQAISIVYSMVTAEYLNSSNIIGLHSGYVLLSNVIPVLIFFLAYVLNPRKLSRLSKSFEALLIAITGFIGWTLLSMIFYPLFYGFETENFELGLLLSYLTTTIVFVVIYTVVLVVLRNKKIWS
jgi:hypothetical protein